VVSTSSPGRILAALGRNGRLWGASRTALAHQLALEDEDPLS